MSQLGNHSCFVILFSELFGSTGNGSHLFFLVAHISRHSAINSHLPVICFCRGRNAGVRWCQGQCDKGTCCIFSFGISINIFWFLLNSSVIFWAYFKPALDLLSPIYNQWCCVFRLWLCALCESCQFLVLPAVVCSKMYRASTHRALFITSNWLSCFSIKNGQSTGVQSCPFSEVYQQSKLVKILGLLTNKT